MGRKGKERKGKEPVTSPKPKSVTKASGTTSESSEPDTFGNEDAERKFPKMERLPHAERELKLPQHLLPFVEDRVSATKKYSLPFPGMIMKMVEKARVRWKERDEIYRVPNSKRFIPHGDWWQQDGVPKQKKRKSSTTSTPEASGSIKRQITRISENNKKMFLQMNPNANFSGWDPDTEEEESSTDLESEDDDQAMEIDPLQRLPPVGGGASADQ
ncbi:hypothetical protein PIB30_100946 [Stylosanthes scabra]|uniref:Uncharacterized protein n=1 Tax=Stylosanthes scabra TaxID=79078 RepID=A0ABU6XWE4_9FABA|nr:hypothetical protein [Stylosanthes scabra]